MQIILTFIEIVIIFNFLFIDRHYIKQTWHNKINVDYIGKWMTNQCALGRYNTMKVSKGVLSRL
jgi:hypothetical protein